MSTSTGDAKRGADQSGKVHSWTCCHEACRSPPPVVTELPPRACAGHAPNGEFDSEPAIFIGMLNTSNVAKRVCSNASILLCDEHNVDGIMLIVILGPM